MTNKQTKTNKMTISDVTTNYLKENNIQYSPDAFSKAMKEVSKTYVCPKYNHKPIDEKMSFINNSLTTDKRLK